MSSRTASVLLGIGLLLVGAGPAAGGAFGQVPRDKLDATVDTTDYTGSPAVGEALSEPPWLGPVPEGTFHEVRLDAVNRQIQIADEASLMAWTFGGTVPGPTLHVKEEATLDRLSRRAGCPQRRVSRHSGGPKDSLPMASQNARCLPLSLHGGSRGEEEAHAEEKGPLEQRYEGIALDVMEHVGHGMIGAVVVEPSGGWPHRADREFVIVKTNGTSTPRTRPRGRTPLSTTRRPHIESDRGGWPSTVGQINT